MPISRRDFLSRSALGLAAAATTTACQGQDKGQDKGLPAAPRLPDAPLLHDASDWNEVRELFSLNPDFIHMSALYVASHPRPVREAIEAYRRELDINPVLFLNQENRRRVRAARGAAAAYLGVTEPNDIALTDSTTMGLGLVYNALRLDRGDEILSTTGDYYATHEALRLTALRTGANVRMIDLFEDIRSVSEESLVAAITKEIRPQTRLIALTWVHSGTGLKLPVARICDAVAGLNSGRDETARILVAIDGVHGFGVEEATMPQLGCDFFIAGCHKWLFGPRGTGIVWGSARGWERVIPIVPSFHDDGTREAWLTGTGVSGRANGLRMTPGGFKPFEHQWAMNKAFELHQEIGKDRVQRRTHELATQLKEGLARMAHVQLRTPMSESVSSGIVCMEVEGLDPWSAVARLRERRIVATVTPYAQRYLRFAPSILNSPQEVETVLAATRELA